MVYKLALENDDLLTKVLHPREFTMVLLVCHPHQGFFSFNIQKNHFPNLFQQFVNHCQGVSETEQDPGLWVSREFP